MDGLDGLHIYAWRSLDGYVVVGGLGKDAFWMKADMADRLHIGTIGRKWIGTRQMCTARYSSRAGFLDRGHGPKERDC